MTITDFMYDYDKAKKALQELKRCYFRPVIAYPDGHLTHDADCNCHRPVDMYDYAPCTCGLNHQLKWLDCSLAVKLNPNYWNESRLQEVGRYFDVEGWQSIRDNKHFLEEALKDNIKTTTPSEDELLEDRDWRLIAEVFGQYAKVLQSIQHDTECQICGWTWCSSLSDKCRGCDNWNKPPSRKWHN